VPRAGTSEPPTCVDVVAAAGRIAGIAHRTPVLTSRTLDELTGARLFLKCENMQRAGAFKFRGACNALASLTDGQRRRGVLAYSSGNHAQALAYAARLAGVRAIIVMPQDAPTMKVAATRGYGAEVRFYDRYTQDREAIAQQLAAAEGLSLIPPYDHPDVIAGQGTAARELFEGVGELDLLLVPLGGGGLLAGSALSASALSPMCRVIGVEPEAGNDGQQSLQQGRIVTIEQPRSIADGAITTHLGQLTFPIIQALADGIVTVPDAALVAAMRFLAERMKLVVEPTGCLGLGAALTDAVPVAGRRVGVILSGGNVDLATFCGLVADDGGARS
jgi:threo-3-hydroxy-L-aspartate ammonia-lyase